MSTQDTSPTGTDLQPIDCIDIAMSKLARPAIALTIMASIEALLVMLALTAIFFTSDMDALPIAIVILLFVSLLLIAFAAAQMRFLESFQMAKIAAILACIPFFSPFVIVGIPFGIWSLQLLKKPEIRNAFSDRTPARPLFSSTQPKPNPLKKPYNGFSIAALTILAPVWLHVGYILLCSMANLDSAAPFLFFAPFVYLNLPALLLGLIGLCPKRSAISWIAFSAALLPLPLVSAILYLYPS